MEIRRKGFLRGLACVAAGAAAGATGSAAAFSWMGGGVHPPAPPPRPQEPVLPPPSPHGEETFSQCGEDRIVEFLCGYLNIRPLDYIDVGAHDPAKGNNTYLFYRSGMRGILIEPNPEMCETLRRVRPEDTVLQAGVGVTEATEADYYVMTDSSWNTFSKEEAERQEKVTNGLVRLKQVVKMPLLDLNRVMAERLKKAPAFLSIDVQGLELPILKSIDYARHRPKVICVETLVTGTKATNPEIPAFMATQGYVVRGMSLVNTIFVDGALAQP